MTRRIYFFYCEFFPSLLLSILFMYMYLEKLNFNLLFKMVMAADNLQIKRKI